MSDTKKITENNIPDNPTIGYTKIVGGKDNKIKIEPAEGRSSGESPIPGELHINHNVMTNETPDGRTVVTDEEGKVIGFLDKKNNGIITRKLAEMDRVEKLHNNGNER